jgi:hypothetical protein
MLVQPFPQRVIGSVSIEDDGFGVRQGCLLALVIRG